VPLNSRGTPRTRFDPLRDGPRSNSAELNPEDDAFLFDHGPMAEDAERGGTELAADLISAVRRQIAALGLTESAEGQSAIMAAEKATESTGSAAAACLHELRMTMDAIRASKPPGQTKDATEDVLERMRQRRAGA
jgi:hypothetical protein